ncbi:MAG TPA: S8 family serine peptidase [Gemmataceae bacterium]|nr:S8 family serine peptidase [Gemmataceae bacterium]
MTRTLRRGAPRLSVDLLEARAVPALAGFGQLAVDHSDYDSSHILVRWQDGTAHLSPITRAAEAIGNGVFRVTLIPSVSVGQAVSFFQGQPGVQFAQPDYRVSIARVPNDPGLGSLWGLNNTGQNGGISDADIDAPEAWNTSVGTGNTVVAVIDTGIDYNHPDLSANMWHNPGEIPGNGRDDDGNGFRDDVYGYDFANNDANPMDDNGHGTHVAGTIGAIGDNGVGVAGIDWHARIMALKFLDASGSGYMSDAVRALNYAVANGAKVVNNSYGGGGYDPAMASAISNARSRGVIVVAAAGNDGTNNDAGPVYPANYAGDNVLTVAATDRTDRLASFSNFGRTSVDIAAPGVGIYSTLPNGKYGTFSGTSMATPHVTGALALVWDAHPTWTYRQVIDAVLAGADRLTSLGGTVATGGRLNVAKAIAGAVGSTPAVDTVGAYVTGVTFTGTGSAINGARVTFNEAINPATFTAADLALNGPGGSIAISNLTPVSGSGNTQFDVTFANQTAAGAYTLAIGPDVRDAAGNAMDQNRNGKAGESADKYTATTSLTASQTFASANVGQTIRDYGKVASTLTITQDVTIRDLNVQVNVSHTYTGDVQMTLVGPDDMRVPLVVRRGRSGDNFVNTVFDDEAPQGIWQGAAPFAGSYRPEYVLSAFDGKSAKGTWQLVVEDTALFDTGKLNGWSLAIQGSTGAAAKTAVAAAPARGAVDLTGLVPARTNAWHGLARYFTGL